METKQFDAQTGLWFPQELIKLDSGFLSLKLDLFKTQLPAVFGPRWTERVPEPSAIEVPSHTR